MFGAANAGGGMGMFGGSKPTEAAPRGMFGSKPAEAAPSGMFGSKPAEAATGLGGAAGGMFGGATKPPVGA